MSFTNKVALVTGAESEIGLVYVKYLLQNRVKVLLCDVNFEHCQSIAKEFAKDFQNAIVLSTKCDVTNAEEFEDAFKTCMKHFGRLDIVINNAGVSENSTERWSTTVNVNYGGIVRGTLLAIKYMGLPNGGKGGTVIQTTSYKVFRDDFQNIPVMYKTTKKSVMEFTKSFGGKHNFDLHGVRIISLCPKITNVDIVDNDACSKKEMNCEDEEVKLDESNKNFVLEKLDHIGMALIAILEQGNTGESWTVENNKPLRLIEY